MQGRPLNEDDPHRIVTAHRIDAAGEPTSAARDEIIAFLRTRLQ